MGRRRIEDKRPELAHWIRDGMTNAEVARRLGVSSATIANACARLGIEQTQARGHQGRAVEPTERARRVVPCLVWHEAPTMAGCLVGKVYGSPFVEMSSIGVVLDPTSKEADISSYSRTLARVPLAGRGWAGMLDCLRQRLPVVAEELKTRHDDPDAQRVGRVLHPRNLRDLGGTT